MTQRIELFLEVCLKELNSFWKYAPKNLIFSNTTQRIELFLEIWLKELNLSFWHDSKFWTFFFGEHDSKNWTFLWIWLDFLRKKIDSKNQNFFYDSRIELFHKTTQSTDFFENMTHRIATFFFSKLWLKELTFWSVTQRIDPFENMTHTQNWTFFSWLKELNSFFW